MARSVEVERQRLRIDSTSVTYEVAGAGQPIILLHGLSGSSRWWSRNVVALSRRFRVHVLDLLGFGGGRRWTGQSFVLSQAADQLAAWMDRLELARASIVGHSMGGFIAADLAARFPQRVDRLVLVDAVALPFDASHLRRPRGLVRAVRRLPLSFLPVLATDAIRTGPITIARTARQLLRTDLASQLALIAAPTLVVWGEHDTIVPPEVGEQLARALPDGRLVTIPSAGHNPMWDRPAEFNRVVAEFLDSGAGGPDGQAGAAPSG